MSVCIEITRGSTAHTKPKCFKNTQEILNYKSFIEHLNLYLLHRMLLFVYPFLRTLSLPLKSKPLLPKLLAVASAAVVCKIYCTTFTINNSTKLLSEKENVHSDGQIKSLSINFGEPRKSLLLKTRWSD